LFACLCAAGDFFLGIAVKLAPNQYPFVRHVFYMSGKMNTISTTGSIYPCFMISMISNWHSSRRTFVTSFSFRRGAGANEFRKEANHKCTCEVYFIVFWNARKPSQKLKDNLRLTGSIPYLKQFWTLRDRKTRAYANDRISCTFVDRMRKRRFCGLDRRATDINFSTFSVQSGKNVLGLIVYHDF
jgi:hypothetical protein